VKGLVSATLLLLLAGGLVAQPGTAWLWAQGAGGPGLDSGNAIVMDGVGNIYVTGRFTGTATFGSTTLSSLGTSDAFIAKLDPAGNWLWVIQTGATQDAEGFGLAVDQADNIYVTGGFSASASFGSTTLTSSGNLDIFIAKLDGSGNWLWAAQAGGTEVDRGYAVAVDSGFNVYITGEFEDFAFFGSLQTISVGFGDVFVAKLDPGGNWLWAKSGGGPYNIPDQGRGIAVDAQANVYITGAFSGTAYFGLFYFSERGSGDIFVAKLDTIGTWLWVLPAGGVGSDWGSGLVLDSSADVYLTGSMSGNAAFGNIICTSHGSTDAFVAKIDTNGYWVWATNAGGSNADNSFGMARDTAGNLCLTGIFRNQAQFGNTTITGTGNTDIFTAKLDPAGNWLWAVNAGGPGMDYGYGIAVDGSGKISQTGFFSGSAGFGSNSITSQGSWDIFIARFDPAGVAIEDYTAPETPELSILKDIYPNPCRRGDSPVLRAEIAERQGGVLFIHNLRGQLISSHRLGSGIHQVSFETSGLPAGIYLCRLETASRSSVKKLVLVGR